jgi:hypothetical protein
VGHVRDNYRSKSGTPIDVLLIEAPDNKIEFHQIVGQAVRGDCKVRVTPFGVIIESVQPDMSSDMQGAPRKASATGPANVSDRPVGLIWCSGDHLLVELWGRGHVCDDLLPLYGKAFPSSLPADMKIDKTAWGRDEAEIRINKLGEVVKAGGQADEKGSAEEFSANLYLLTNSVKVPDVSDAALVRTATADERKAEHLRIRAWWDANKMDTTWDEDQHQLVLQKRDH